MLNERGGTMSQQEFAVAEAPQHADAGQPAITGGSDVNIAIADIDGKRRRPLLTEGALRLGALRGKRLPQLAQSLKHGVRGRLFTDALGLMFADGDIYLWEEVGDERLRGSHHLVADHR